MAHTFNARGMVTGWQQGGHRKSCIRGIGGMCGLSPFSPVFVYQRKDLNGHAEGENTECDRC